MSDSKWIMIFYECFFLWSIFTKSMYFSLLVACQTNVYPFSLLLQTLKSRKQLQSTLKQSQSTRLIIKMAFNLFYCIKLIIFSVEEIFSRKTWKPRNNLYIIFALYKETHPTPSPIMENHVWLWMYFYIFSTSHPTLEK